MNEAPTLSDSLRTIGARLCTREDSQVDGRMVLALAESAGRLESQLAERNEAVAELAIQLNDPLNTIQRIVNEFGRPHRAVDGTPNPKLSGAERPE